MNLPQIAVSRSSDPWQQAPMVMPEPHAPIHGRLIDALYTEAMLLADEARAYFDIIGRNERDALTPLVRVTFSCESLKVTTRLMHVIAWLLTQRAIESGEMPLHAALDPARRLGTAPVTEMEVRAMMPAAALVLIDASIDLYRRVARLDAAQVDATPVESPVQSMLQRLRVSF